MMPLFSKSGIGRDCITVFFTVFFCGFVNTVSSQSSEILPLCGVVASAAEWDGLSGSTLAASVFNGDVIAGESNYIVKGLYFGCASQLRMSLRQVFVPGGYYWESNQLVQLPKTFATPDTFDAAKGDGQPLTITATAPATTLLTSCFPGHASQPNALCPAEVFNDLSDGGVMIYRLRGNDGQFSGPWTVSRGGYSPGFAIRKIGTCTTPNSSCKFEIVFNRDTDGFPVVKHDVQAILQLLVQLPVTETGGAYNSTMAVPIFVKQQGGPSATPVPTPVINNSFCVVPKVKGKRLRKATQLLNENGCIRGKVTRKFNKRWAKGFVIGSTPKLLAVQASGAPVDLKVSKGPRL